MIIFISQTIHKIQNLWRRLRFKKYYIVINAQNRKFMKTQFYIQQREYKFTYIEYKFTSQSWIAYVWHIELLYIIY